MWARFESIIRELVVNAVRMVQNEFSNGWKPVRPSWREDRLASPAVNPPKKKRSNLFEVAGRQERAGTSYKAVKGMLTAAARGWGRPAAQRAAGGPGNRNEVEDTLPQLEVGATHQHRRHDGRHDAKKTIIRRVKRKEGEGSFLRVNRQALIDEDEVREEAIRRAEQQGTFFIG